MSYQSQQQPQHEQSQQGSQYGRQQSGQYGRQQSGQYGRQPTESGAYGQQTGMQGQQTGMQEQQAGMQGIGGQQVGMRGQQFSDQQTGMHGQQGQQPEMQTQPHSFDDHMTDELRIVLEDFSELSHVAAWCATACASGGPELGTCARICQDLAEVADLNEMLIARNSMFGPEVAEMFLRVAAEGLPELRRFQQRHPHVIETIATIERTMNSCETVLQQVGEGTQMGGNQQSMQSMQGSSEHVQGPSEQRQYAHGPSGHPTGGSEMPGQRY